MRQLCCSPPPRACELPLCFKDLPAASVQWYKARRIHARLSCTYFCRFFLLTCNAEIQSTYSIEWLDYGWSDAIQVPRSPLPQPHLQSPLSTSPAFRVLATLLRGTKPRRLGITAVSLRVCWAPGKAEILSSSRQYRSLFQEPRHSSFIPMQLVVPYAMRERGEKRGCSCPAA